MLYVQEKEKHSAYVHATVSFGFQLRECRNAHFRIFKVVFIPVSGRRNRSALLPPKYITKSQGIKTSNDISSDPMLQQQPI